MSTRLSITLRPKLLQRPPSRPWPRRPQQTTGAEFQPLLSKFPTLDLTWPAAVRAAWWVQFTALRQLAQQLDAEADAQTQAARE